MTPDVASFSALSPILPEIVLTVGALFLILLGAIGGARFAATVTGITVAVMALAGLILIALPSYGSAFNGAFVLDGFARYLKILILIGASCAIAMSVASPHGEIFERFEYPILILLSTLGMMLMVSSSDLIALYLGLELQSLAMYVTVAIDRDNRRSTEAGVKYFVLGALSSGMLLYGMSLVYGFTGHTEFTAIAETLTVGPPSLGVVFGLVFILAGLAFKISAVPFHMWTPDVYEGAPTPVTALLASAPKVAAIGMLVRLSVDAFGPITGSWQQILIFLAIASMVFGAFAALAQRNIKRLMAYSSIANMGFALVGLAAGTATGVQGVVVYMTAYLAMTLGAFACILAMRRREGTVEAIEDLRGLARRSPTIAALLGILMLSLAGLPPFVGFFGKFYVFLAAVEVGLYPLAVIGVLASVIALFYYLRIVKIMFFDEPAAPFLPMPNELRVILGLTSAFVVLFPLFAGGMLDAATAAAMSLF